MLKASPSSSAPGWCSGAQVICLFCMLRTRPLRTASVYASRSEGGTCSSRGLGGGEREVDKE